MRAQIAAQRDRNYDAGLEPQQTGESDSSAHSGNVASARLHIIIPVLNEEAALAVLLPKLAGCLRSNLLVVDNGSTDASAAIAMQAGARVIHEPERGYGAACLAGIAALEQPRPDDVVLFMDGDASDDIGDIPELLAPIEADRVDLVIGSRISGWSDRGALPLHARLGNRLAAELIFRATRVRYSDLGPLRAIRYGVLCALEMRQRGYGWTVEMQLKAAQRGVRVCEVPVRYHRRIGASKISGTLAGSMRAGLAILQTVLLHGR